MSVLDNIMVGRHHLLRNNALTGALYWLSGARREELSHRRKVEDIIDFLEIAHIRKSVAGTLPYGLRKRVELARAMAAEPKLLIADESMAGLSHSEVEDIVALLIRMNERGVTIIMIEHIMRAVMTFSQRVVVLVSGKKIADGNPDDVMKNTEVVGAYLGT